MYGSQAQHYKKSWCCRTEFIQARLCSSKMTARFVVLIIYAPILSILCLKSIKPLSSDKWHIHKFWCYRLQLYYLLNDFFFIDLREYLGKDFMCRK